jgi:oligopeptide transport system permease protein
MSGQTSMGTSAAVSLSPIHHSLYRQSLQRFVRSRSAMLGLFGTLTFAIACFGTLPWTIPAYNVQHLHQVLEPPSWSHWMGTDGLGRDLMVRFLLGGAISLSIGLSAAAITLTIGTAIGVISGYAGGRIDAVLMRTVDVLYGLPYLLLVILLRVAVVSRVAEWLSAMGVGSSNGLANIVVLLVGIGAVSWLNMARVIRSQVMSLRTRPFVDAARSLGLSPWRIGLRHILPNIAGTIAVYATLAVPGAIIAESTLSFLGLGVQRPLPTWGTLASDAVADINPISSHWWIIFWPCFGLAASLICLNFLGDGLRDALAGHSS